ncbi:MAG: ribosome recycling factor [Flavobacteriales bacterium]|jgi:ribosome recycling factor|nr:ribosome recycling factor [Flavobacteriales bacterium]MBK9287922.1 ribosome recycling factor [Flavobacteriales bacterium]MBL0037064.1 ribosome recycling factor [Flavobacteriales bacterium]
MDIKSLIAPQEDLMNKAVDHLDHELTKVRAGRANPAMLDGVRVDAYGAMMPLNQVANINTPDARTIMIQPWDKKMFDAIEKAIQAANLGFNPSNNGESVIINVPMLTEERRKDLVKTAHKEGEHARVSIRGARQKAMEAIKASKLPEDVIKDGQDQVEKMTASYNKKVEALIEAKEKDILKV